MTQEEIAALLDAQRAYFASGKTLPVKSRASALEALDAAIKRRESEIYAALKADLGKSDTESFLCEVGMTLSELGWMRRHLRRLARPRRVHTPLAQFAAASTVRPSPYGNVLIMSPWNYPLMLTLEPLIDALAAGNTAVVKPSAYAPATSAVIASLLGECFEPGYVAVITGGRAENQALLNQRFDKIFFTGGKAVGREVLRHAAETLTPAALELGGKSPCIVDATANIHLAARRIVFGKYLNCGQTCVAPDYIYCDAKVRDALVSELQFQIHAQYGREPLSNENYGRIVNEKHFARLRGLYANAGEQLVCGGRSDAATLKIEPTVLQNVSFDDPVMGEEIFGPILPVLTYQNLDEAIEKIESLPHPLALYLFSENAGNKEKVLNRCRFGGGCVNDTIIHLATSAMGFGGVGESGMGQYHGKTGFAEFSHDRSIVDKMTWMDLPVRYAPYTKLKTWLVKFFMR